MMCCKGQLEKRTKGEEDLLRTCHTFLDFEHKQPI